MKRYVLVLTILFSFLKGEILILLNNKNAYPWMIKRISSLFKKEKIVISPTKKFSQIDMNPRLVFCFEEQAVENFPDKLVNVPTLLFYVKDPLLSLKLNMTGVLYVYPPSVVFSFMNAIKWRDKKIITIISEGGKNASYVQDALRIARSFNISLEVLEVKMGKILEITESLVDADLIWLFPNEITTNPAFLKYIIRFSLEKKKPIIGYSRELTRKGFIFGIEVDEKEYRKKIFKILEEIKRGRNPLTIPLQYPDEFNYYYNSKMAKVMGIKVDFSGFYKEVKYVGK